MLIMENAEEVLQILERFSKLKQKDIPKELDDYLCYVAETGDTVYRWPMVKYLFREKLAQVIKEFYENTPSIADLPQDPNVDPFNYETMKTSLIDHLEFFHAAPFTVQRICELLTDPRKQYSRIDKFMRAIEKNILVVSTVEPGRRPEPVDSNLNGDLSSESIDSDENNLAFNELAFDIAPKLRSENVKVAEEVVIQSEEKTTKSDDEKVEEVSKPSEDSTKSINGDEKMVSDTLSSEPADGGEKVEDAKLEQGTVTVLSKSPTDDDASEAPSSTVLTITDDDSSTNGSSDSSSDFETKLNNLPIDDVDLTPSKITGGENVVDSSESPRIGGIKRSCEEMSDKSDVDVTESVSEDLKEPLAKKIADANPMVSEVVANPRDHEYSTLNAVAEVQVEKIEVAPELVLPSIDELKADVEVGSSDLVLESIVDVLPVDVNLLAVSSEVGVDADVQSSVAESSVDIVEKLAEAAPENILLDQLIESTVFEAIPSEVKADSVESSSSEESLPTSSSESPTIIAPIISTIENEEVSSTPIEYTESSLSDLPIDIEVSTSRLSSVESSTETPIPIIPLEEATIESSSIDRDLTIEPSSNSETEIPLQPVVPVAEVLLEMDTTTSDESKMDDDDESSSATIVAEATASSSTIELPKVDDNAMDVDESVEPMDQ